MKHLQDVRKKYIVTPSQITPQPIPPWSREGITATPEQLGEVGVPRKGIIPIGLPPSAEEIQVEREGAIGRAGYLARERTEEEVKRFEGRYQPESQDITQQRFNELMGDKARELGMSYQDGIWYYTSEEQKQRWDNYTPIAQMKAIEEGQAYYSDQWAKEDIEGRLKQIYEEEYKSQGFVIVGNVDGTYNIIPREDYEKQQRYKEFKEEYIKKEYDNILERFEQGGKLTTAYLAHPEYLFQSIYEQFFGTAKGVKEKESLALFEMEEAKIKEGVVGIVKEMYGPGSLPFTVGTAYLAGATFGVAIGGISQLSPVVAKGVQTVAGGYFLGRTAADIKAVVTTGRVMEYGGLLGLAPMGLSKQAQVMTEAERFASVAMLGVTASFAIVGYAKGLKLGRKFIAGVYKPKYVEVRQVFPKLAKVAESEYGIAFKGGIKYQAIRIRTIFGKQIPWGKEVYTADLPVKGILGKKQVTYISKEGKVAVWRPGEAWYTLEKGMLFKKVFGITLSKKYPGGGIYKAYPTRPLKVDVTKKMGISIEPYIKQTKLATVFTEKPGMSLMLTQKQLSAELFKPLVESKYYPSISKSVVKGGIASTKAITQIWELSEAKKIMKVPHIERVKVKYFEFGKPLEAYKGGEVADVYGFTYKGGDKPPVVWIREPTPSEKLPIDMFGRRYGEPISSVIRHEIIHRKVPWISEFEVQAIAGKRFPFSKILASEEAKFVDVLQLKKMHKVTYPQVDKAVKEYWRTGELEAFEQYGTEKYELTPFRQVSKTVTPFSITTGRGFGIVAVLKGIETPKTILKGNIISQWSKGSAKAQKVLFGKPKQPGKPSGELVTVTELKFKPSVPSIDINLLWGEQMPSGYLTGLAFVTMLKPTTEQESMIRQGEIEINKFMTAQAQRLGLEKLPAMTTIEDTKLGKRQAQAQLQLQLQIQQLLTTQITTPVTVAPPVVVPIVPIIPILLSGEEMKKLVPNVFSKQAYDVYVKPRTYRSGKRIRADIYNIKLTKHSVNVFDADYVGQKLVDSNEKASYIKVPVEGKPRKIRRSKNYLEFGGDFYINKKGQVIEKASARMDSPGEIEAITMKGIEANRRKGRGRDVFDKKSRGLDLKVGKVNEMVEKTFKKLMKKAGVV